MDEEGAAGGFDAGAKFEPIFGERERTRGPRDGLNDDGVDQGDDVEGAKNGTAAGRGPAEKNPGAPEQVQKEDGFDENTRGKNGRYLG